MKALLQILYLEDDPNDAELVHSTLTNGSVECEIVRVETREAFIDAIQKGGFNLIFVDYKLPTFDGISALAIAKEKCPDIPLIVISGTMGEDIAIETLKSGATDYVLKHRLSRLVPAVKRALREAEERKERKQAKEKLRKSEEKYRELVENLTDILFTIDSKGIITYISPVIKTVTGYEPSEAIGHHFTDFVFPEDMKKITGQFQKILSGHIEPSEYRVVTKSGDVLWVRSSSRPVYVDKRIVGLQGLLTDISDRKQKEEEIKKRVKELEDFYEMAVGRELRMVELKEKIEELKEELLQCRQKERGKEPDRSSE